MEQPDRDSRGGRRAQADRPVFNNERNTDDPDVHTVEMESEGGERVVLEQQNVGPDNEMGNGEFPDPDEPPKDPASAAREQEELDRR